ncbi:MAG: hypothetical protein B6242_05135 [Anaerolineaceae bacterium 4572_78]|nr:MAG: hypothetical protein B6242_05135 [Anaerolineaceae bacterium 4572_78]
MAKCYKKDCNSQAISGGLCAYHANEAVETGKKVGKKIHEILTEPEPIDIPDDTPDIPLIPLT